MDTVWKMGGGREKDEKVNVKYYARIYSQSDFIYFHLVRALWRNWMSFFFSSLSLSLTLILSFLSIYAHPVILNKLGFGSFSSLRSRGQVC